MGIIKQTIVKCDSCGVEAKCGSLNSFDAIAAMKRRGWIITFGKKEKKMMDIKCNGCAAAPLPQKEKTYPFESLETGIQHINSLILIGEYTLVEGLHGYFWLHPNRKGERTIDSVYAEPKEAAIKNYVIATARQMGYDWAFE